MSIRIDSILDVAAAPAADRERLDNAFARFMFAVLLTLRGATIEEAIRRLEHAADLAEREDDLWPTNLN
jgi:hypothetical protein